MVQPRESSLAGLRGRAGLVGTQNIRNNKSREGGLDHIVRTGVIVEAVDNQPWSGEANVHVSIANWVKHSPSPSQGEGQGEGHSLPSPSGRGAGGEGILNSSGPLPLEGRAGEGVSPADGSSTHTSSPLPNPLPQGEGTGGNKIGSPGSRDAKGPPAAERAAPRTINEPALLIPAKRKLWFKVEAAPGAKKPKRRGTGPANKEYELDFVQCDRINAALSHGTSVSEARILKCNTTPQIVFQGITPGHDGFVLTPEDRASLIARDSKSESVIFPYLVGRELLSGSGRTERYLIDFQQRSVIQAQEYPAAFTHVQSTVLPIREEIAKKDLEELGEVRSHHKQFLERWWKLAWDRADMLERIDALHGRYLVCSSVTKRPVFTFVSDQIRPGDALQVFCFDDDYSFGILQSNTHWRWFVAKCSKLKSDFRYTPESVFDTFPWPQSPAAKLVAAVAEAGREVRRVREDALTKVKGGLRAVYRTSNSPARTPSKTPTPPSTPRCSPLTASARRKTSSPSSWSSISRWPRQSTVAKATAPGIPPDYPNPKSLITTDCIRPA